MNSKQILNPLWDVCIDGLSEQSGIKVYVTN